jgi:hypothetical protein
LSQIDLTITTLSNLCEDLEVPVSETSATFAQISTLTAKILVHGSIVFFHRSVRRSREGGFEGGFSSLTVVDVRQKVEVVVEEV